jgi:hypothetical protein
MIHVKYRTLYNLCYQNFSWLVVDKIAASTNEMTWRVILSKILDPKAVLLGMKTDAEKRSCIVPWKGFSNAAYDLYI